MSDPLVLSLFPGIGLLDCAFEEEGFCVVRGPDVLWGGDIRRFHPPTDTFDGVIGGPPCQTFSALMVMGRAKGQESRFGNLIPEFERVVAEAWPAWFLMENVPGAPEPDLAAFHISSTILNNRWFGAEQNRTRRFSFGSDRSRGDPIPLSFDVSLFESCEHAYAVTSGHMARWQMEKGLPRYSVPEACRLQGLPEDYLDHAAFTKQGALQAVANGVPLPMGRAVARAVKRAMYP